MKKLKPFLKICLTYMALITLFIFGGISCEQEPLLPDSVAGDNVNSYKGEQKKANQKIDICHRNGKSNHWNVLSVNENSWAAHSLHGDIRLDDQDGDGYVPYNECGIGNMGDCDDLDSTIYPGAPEIYNDGIDQDCNGVDATLDCPCFTGEDLAKMDRSAHKVVGYGPCVLQFQDGKGNITFNAAAGCDPFPSLPGANEAWLVDYLYDTVNWTPATKPECGGLTDAQVLACQQLLCERANAKDMFDGQFDCNNILQRSYKGEFQNNINTTTTGFKLHSEGPIKIFSKKQ